VRRVVVQHEVHVELPGHARVDVLEEAEELLMAVALLALREHLAGADVERGEERRRAVPDVAVRDALDVAEPQRDRRLRALERLDLALLVHAQDERLVGLRYSPAMSRTFSKDSGSVERLKRRVRCGCTPKSAEYRATVLLAMPVCAATTRTLQWVPAFGFEARTVRRSTATRSSSCARGRPLRGASERPASPCRWKRRRQWPTVWIETPSRAAIWVSVSPAADARTICARRTWLYGRVRAAASVARCARSVSLSVSSKRCGLTWV
jgi:hypothetical protein